MFIWIQIATLIPHLWEKGGPKDELEKLYEEVSADPKASIKSYSERSVARLLFIYFKKLPTPLLGFDLHDYFIGASCSLHSLPFCPAIPSINVV